MLRYYVISRVEEYGRLAIESSGKYADLIVLDRKPRELEKIVFAGDDKATEYVLTPAEEYDEGDRTEHRFDFTQADVRLDSLANNLKEVLQTSGNKAKAILEMSGERKRAKLEEIRRMMKLRAVTKEADVLSFIKMLLSNNCGARQNHQGEASQTL